MILSDQSSFDFTTLADFVVQFLAVAYGVFATATDFKETTADGKKHLSKAGIIGIAFLIVISVASIGVKIYQHAKDSKAQGEAQAAQHKIVQELEQGLGNSEAMSKTLNDANTKLAHEADMLKQQAAKMSDLTEGSQEIIHATSRVLDPLDDSFEVYVQESLKRSEPDLDPYLRRIGTSQDVYMESKNSPDWPKLYDGDFGKYANWRTVSIRFYPISELQHVMHPKTNAPLPGGQLQTEFVCSTPDQGKHSRESIHLWQDEVFLECQANDVEWTRSGGTRSYRDLKNSFLYVELSTIVGVSTASHLYAPTLKNLEVVIFGKNHRLEANSFYQVPCVLELKEACYISRMPLDD